MQRQWVRRFQYAPLACCETTNPLSRGHANRNHLGLPRRHVELSALELKLLRYFIEHKGATLSRDELLRNVWEYDAMPYSRTVDVHVSGLRQKIEETPSKPRHVVTVHGLGYKFVG